MIRDLIIKNRSYRRFYEEIDIKLETLEKLIDLARLSASAMNAQPIKYILSCERQMNSLIFPYLTLGAYLKDWSGPGEGERPAAYIIILGDIEIGRFWEPYFIRWSSLYPALAGDLPLTPPKKNGRIHRGTCCAIKDSRHQCDFKKSAMTLNPTSRA